ncbi:hypothetical protein SOVF_035580 [Spinacia oleracea]|nr:hypothetical protein SOVF_035580 [Spinacia oleracea]
MRDLFAKICDLRELLNLSESFVLNRKIMSYNMTCDSVSCLLVVVLQEGKTMWPRLIWLLQEALYIVLASISKAVDHTGCM